MSSIVCRGLQSCLEPRLIEPLVLRHKMGPPKSNLSQSSPWPQRPSQTRQQQELHQKNSHNEEENNTKDSNNNGGLGGWSFIQALTKTPHNCNCTEVLENEKAYVHPLLERSSSSLSKKSLEMCTESLGSETGSGISDELSPLSLKSENSHPIQLSKSREFSKKLTGSGSFPPPLTSISGSDSVQVRPHREGGRLVIKAVTVASCNTYFQAERVDGRLRLCLLKDTSLNSGNEVADEGKEKVNSGAEEVAGGVVEEHACAGETKAAGESYVDDDDCGDDHDHGDDDADDDDDDDKWVDGIGGNSGNVGCETDIGEFPRPSRCKEGWWAWEQRDAKLVPIS